MMEEPVMRIPLKNVRKVRKCMKLGHKFTYQAAPMIEKPIAKAIPK